MLAPVGPFSVFFYMFFILFGTVLFVVRSKALFFFVKLLNLILNNFFYAVSVHVVLF